jgi:hypothetical protein
MQLTCIFSEILCQQLKGHYSINVRTHGGTNASALPDLVVVMYFSAPDLLEEMPVRCSATMYMTLLDGILKPCSVSPGKFCYTFNYHLYVCTTDPLQTVVLVFSNLRDVDIVPFSTLDSPFPLSHLYMRCFKV